MLSEERELLWQALRERGLSAERQYETQPGVQIDLALLCVLGNLGVQFGSGEKKEIKERPGWQYLAVDETNLKQNLPATLTQIESAVKALGGLKAEPGK